MEISETEKRILQAARSVFIKKGMTGARMHEIAEEAGINKALLHYYFRSKDQLFDAIFRSVFSELAPAIISQLENKLPFAEKVEGVVNLYIDMFSKQPYLPLFILNELHRSPDRLQPLQGMASMVKGTRFMKEYNEGVKNGIYRNIGQNHLLLNLISLILFPILASPLFIRVFELDEMSVEHFWAERKRLVPELFIQSITLQKYED